MSTRSNRGGAWPCQCASQATISSRRPRLRGGLVSDASRWATAALADGCPLGRSRQTARSSAKDIKFVIGDVFPYAGGPGRMFSKFAAALPWRAPAASLAKNGTSRTSCFCRDCLDLDLDLPPGKTRDDHQRRGRRRQRHVAVAHRHVGCHVGTAGDVRIDPHDIRKRHAGFGQTGADGLEAQDGLGLGSFRNFIAGRYAELPGTQQPTRPGWDFDGVTIARKWRADPLRCQMSKYAHQVKSPALIAWRSAPDTSRQRSL